MGGYTQVKRPLSPTTEGSSTNVDGAKPSRYQGPSSGFTRARSASQRRAGSASGEYLLPPESAPLATSPPGSEYTSSSTMPGSDDALLPPMRPDALNSPRWSSGGYSIQSANSAAMPYSLSPIDFLSKDEEAEPDDYLHTPDKKDKNHGVSCVGCLNIAMLLGLAMLLMMLFAGYPILVYFSKPRDLLAKLGIGPGGTNATGQIPQLDVFHLVDPDTPEENRAWTNHDGDPYSLVFSDEFNVEGRTFWPGDDPFWEAVEIWYGATGDTEWYSPEAINTTGGHLVISLEEKETHYLNFQSGMLQSWNKLCFQGGYIEFNLLQPGTAEEQGFWPAAWIMGNLGRPGYLGTTDGMWPYSYQGCDTGILPNQTALDGSGPDPATNAKSDFAKHGELSYLPGMRASACTCADGDHPGPNRKTGRSAPEIDIIEAQIQEKRGVKHGYASQSLQVAPFDEEYLFHNDTNDYVIFNPDITAFNSYHGSIYQEAVSSVTQTPDDNYQRAPTPRFVRYGVEYEPDWNSDGSGFTRWYMDGKPTWEVRGSALRASPPMQISQRTIPTEPMSIIMNLGMSPAFQTLDFKTMQFPAQIKFDYVRVYQPKGQEPRLSCDPPDHPTADYIARHKEIYYNPNVTVFPEPFPLNKLTAAAAGQPC